MAPRLRREETGAVKPLGIFHELPEDPYFAMLLAICNNTAIIADRLDSILNSI